MSNKLLLLLLCLSINYSGFAQTKNKIPKNSKSWQTIILDQKGMKFKLPPDWKPNDTQVELKNEKSTLILDSWISSNSEQLAVAVKTFASEKPTDFRKRELLEKRFKHFLPMAHKSIYGEIKKLKIGKTEGFIRKISIDSAGITEKRIGFSWTGYRIYQGKLQEIEIDLNSYSDGVDILQKVFATIEIEESQK